MDYDFVVDEDGILSPTPKRISSFKNVIDVMEIESDSECIHGLGPIAACVICNGREKKEALEEAIAKQIVRQQDNEVIIHFNFNA